MTQHKHHDHQGSCPSYDIGPFIRNNYFRGKFMDVLDFTTEQRYFTDKLRHHHQHLHGWGVVCGLKVKQHPNSDCQNRFICIESGSAIDCCGHEILLLEEECIDFTQLPAVKALIDKKDTDPHRLQICLRYRECPTEPVPVLYDDCGCDETRCAPNRILESFEFDAIIDAKDEPAHVYAPKFKWDSTLNIAHAYRAVLHDATDPPRLYALTEDDKGVVYQVDPVNHSVIISAYNLNAKGIALAVSNDGTRVYVVIEPDATKERQLYVLNTTKSGLSTSNTNPINIPNSASGDVLLAVAPDGHLLALLTGKGELLRWDTDIDSKIAPDAPKSLIELGANLNALVIGSDGKTAYAAGTSDKIQIFPFTANKTSQIDLPPGAKVTSMSMAKSTGSDILAVADLNGNLVHLWPTNSASLSTITVSHPPFALTASPDAQWLYVLEREDKTSYLEAINIQGELLGDKIQLGEPFEIGHPAQGLALTQSGDRLYIPYPGDLTLAGVGGVAVADISEQNCCEIPWRQLDGCPDCDTPNCVLLATIENFRVGDSIKDQTAPPAKPDDDKAKNIARIDNRKGRRLLPTPQVLLELIECLKQQGPAGKGTQGPTGATGATGETGPTGPAGPGLETGLVRIEALSWSHGEPHVVVEGANTPTFHIPITLLNDNEKVRGIVIGFTDFVDTTTIDADHVFQILAEHTNSNDSTLGWVCRCAIRGTILPVDLDVDNANGNRQIILNKQGRIENAKEAADPTKARGVAFILDIETAPIARDIINGFVPELWILLRGDFVLDEERRAIDAEFTRSKLPTGDRPSSPNDKFGIQGGTFESWFTIKREHN